MADGFSIDVVRHDDDLAAVAELFRECQAWLDQPVCFQNFEYEFANLTNVYAPPAGELWLVRRNSVAIGVVGMVPYVGSCA